MRHPFNASPFAVLYADIDKGLGIVLVSDYDLEDISVLYTRREGTECVRMKDGNQTRDVEIGSDHIVADRGLEDADKLLTRTALGIQVMKTLRERGFSQQEAGKRLGLTQPEVSAIMRATFRRFSQERLIGLLYKLEQKVPIHLTRYRKGEPSRQVTISP